MKITKKDKVRGMFYGVAIGDALGMPVETYTAEEIQKSFGRIVTYVDPKPDHKWYGNKLKAGMTTDDTQLTIAVAESLIANGELRIISMTTHHIEEYRKSTIGWGGSTKRAVLKLANNTDPSRSGIPEKPNQGCGNGVVMKIAPIAGYMESPYFFNNLNAHMKINIWENIIDFTYMTHRTGMAGASSMAHINVLRYCINSNYLNFSGRTFLELALQGSLLGQDNKLDKQYGIQDNLSERLEELLFDFGNHFGFKETTDKKIIKDYIGTSYVFNSLPFSYKFFLRNPHSIGTLYDVINAGGDTDTNGSIVGGMLGALNGMEIFPQNLIDELREKNKIDDLTERFCKTFDISD